MVRRHPVTGLPGIHVGSCRARTGLCRAPTSDCVGQPAEVAARGEDANRATTKHSPCHSLLRCSAGAHKGGAAVHTQDLAGNETGLVGK